MGRGLGVSYRMWLLIKAAASSVSGLHNTFLSGDLRVKGPAISPSRSQEVEMSRAQRCIQGSTFKHV